MKIKTSKGLEDISTAVFYRRHPFIPTNISAMTSDLVYKLLEDSTSTEVYHLGSLSTSDLLDFAEYDFSFEPDKGRFLNILKLNYLDAYSKNIIGYDTKENTRLNDIIFPQISSNPIYAKANAAVNGDPSYSYQPILPRPDSVSEKFFGAIEVSHQTIALLKVSGEINEGLYDGVYKIEIYNDHIKGNCQRKYKVGSPESSIDEYREGFIEWDALKQVDIMGMDITKTVPNGPVITIYLGPQPEHKNIEIDKRCSWFYKEGLLYENKGSLEIDNREYEGLMHELSDEKIIWFLISSDGTANEINLAYKAWTDCRTKHRNMNQYLLRNDEFFSTKDSIDMFHSFLIDLEKENEILYDSTSNTVLGTKRILTSQLPILNERRNKGNKLGWSPHITYRKGDKVSINMIGWDGKPLKYNTFRSLTDENRGNDPRYSTQWIKDTVDITSEFYRFFVGSNITGAGSISPSGTMIFENIVTTAGGEEIGVIQEFNVKLNPGYILFNNIQVDGDDVINMYSPTTEPNDQGEQRIMFDLRALDKGRNHDYQVAVQFKRVGYNTTIVARCIERGISEYYTSSYWGKFNSSGFSDGTILLENTKFGINSYFPTTSLKKLFEDTSNSLISTEISDKVVFEFPKQLEALAIKSISYVDSKRGLLGLLSSYSGEILEVDEKNQLTISPDNTYNYILIDLERRRYTIRIASYTGVDVNKIKEDVIFQDTCEIKMKGEGGKDFNRILIKNKYNSSQMIITQEQIGQKTDLDGGTTVIFKSQGSGDKKYLSVIFENVSSDLDLEILYT